MYTRKEFERMRKEKAAEMAADTTLRKDALNVLTQADVHNWIHQSNWMGEPVLQLPQDMFAFQEIVYRTRPKYIIEVGVAWAGSLLFQATLLDMLGGKEVIGIDIFMPDDLKERIASKGKLSERIRLINASSTEESTLNQVRELVGDSNEVMVILDSDHTHDHVLKELQLYSPLVGPGQYMICGDTIIDDLPPHPERHRSWCKGNSPRSALDVFLSSTTDFEVDQELENKLLFTCNPGGYLRRKG